MKNLKRDIILNTFSNFLQLGMRWLLNLILAQTFSPLFYGKFTLFYSIANIFSILFTFGSNLFLLHKAREGISTLIKSIILTVSIFLFVLFIVIVLLPKYLVVLLLAFTLALNINLFSFYKGIGLFDKEVKLNLIFSFALLIVIFLILGKFISSVNLLMLILSGINLVIFLIGLIYICYNFSCRINLKINLIFLVKTELKKRFTYGIHEVFSILFKNLEFILLSIYAGNKCLGEYRALYNLVFPFYTIATVTSQVLLSRLSFYPEDKKFLLRRFIILITSISFLLVIILYEIYPFLFQILYNSKVPNITYKLTYLVMLINLVVYLLKSTFEVTLTAIGKQTFRVRVLTIFIFFLIVIDYFTIKLGGIFGHSLAILIANILMLFVYARKTLVEI